MRTAECRTPPSQRFACATSSSRGGVFKTLCYATLPLEEGQREGALLATTEALASQRSAVRPSEGGGSCKLGFVEIEYNMVEKQYNSKFNIKELKETRRELRLNGTSAEAVMWTHIKGRKINGRRWRRQFSVGPFIIDFYCPELKLGIELDGAPHFVPGGYEADELRTDYLCKNVTNIKQ